MQRIPRTRDAEAQIHQDFRDRLRCQIQPGQTFDLGDRKRDRCRCRRSFTRNPDFGNLAAAQVDDHLCGQIDPGLDRTGIDTTLEPVARIRFNAGRPACGAGDLGIKPGALDKDINGAVGDAGHLPAHHTTQAKAIVFIGNHALLGGRRIVFAIQRLEPIRLALAAARNNRLADLAGIIDVQGAAAVIGDEIGDIGEDVDRAQADGFQLAFQPVRRGTILDAANIAPGKDRTGLRIVQPDLDRAGKSALDLLRCRRDHLAQSCSGEVARNPVHA